MPVDQEERLQEEYDVGRGNRAKAILENPLFIEAFQNLDDVWTQALRTAPLNRPEALTHARLCLEVLALVKREIEHVLMTGKMTEQAVQDREESERRLAAERAEFG